MLKIGKVLITVNADKLLLIPSSALKSSNQNSPGLTITLLIACQIAPQDNL